MVHGILPYCNSAKVWLGGPAMEISITTTATIIQDLSFPTIKLLKNAKVLQKEQEINSSNSLKLRKKPAWQYQIFCSILSDTRSKTDPFAFTNTKQFAGMSTRKITFLSMIDSYIMVQYNLICRNLIHLWQWCNSPVTGEPYPWLSVTVAFLAPKSLIP